VGRWLSSRRAKAFTKGNVTYAAVLTAIRLAQQHGVPPDAISATLAMHSLMWDSGDGRVTVLSGEHDRQQR